MVEFSPCPFCGSDENTLEVLMIKDILLGEGNGKSSKLD